MEYILFTIIRGHRNYIAHCYTCKNTVTDVMDRTRECDYMRPY